MPSKGYSGTSSSFQVSVVIASNENLAIAELIANPCKCSSKQWIKYILPLHGLAVHAFSVYSYGAAALRALIVARLHQLLT